MYKFFNETISFSSEDISYISLGLLVIGSVTCIGLTAATIGYALYLRYKAYSNMAGKYLYKRIRDENVIDEKTNPLLIHNQKLYQRVEEDEKLEKDAEYLVIK